MIFEGRPNRKYCSAACKRKYEIAKRRQKNLENRITPAVTTVEDNMWNDLPTVEDIFSKGRKNPC